MPNAAELPPLPTDLSTAHAMIQAEREARLASEIAVERLKLEVARLRRERFGASSERSARIDQLELTLEDLQETLAETEAQAAHPDEHATPTSSRRKPVRRPLPEHLPLHRQSQRFTHESVSIDVSTLAGWVGAVTTALSPLVVRIEAHARGGERLHLDDTPVPVLAKGKIRTGRLWTVVRDDRPLGGPEPPVAAYLYSLDRSPACMLRTGSATSTASSAPPTVLPPMNAARTEAFARPPSSMTWRHGYGRTAPSSWTFAGSDTGGNRAAALYTLIENAKLNRIAPQAWLADVLARVTDHPARRIDDLLPWNWTPSRFRQIAA